MTAGPTLVHSPADPVADSYLSASLHRLGPACAAKLDRGGKPAATPPLLSGCTEPSAQEIFVMDSRTVKPSHR